MKQDKDLTISLMTLVSLLRDTDRCNESVMNKIISSPACRRFQSMRQQTAFDTQVKAGAWIDAAITLVTIALPTWTIRRIVRDDGLWLCSLSRHIELPIEFDDTAEGFHHDLALAILSAFVQARLSPDAGASPVATPKLRPDEHDFVCCENFV